MLNAINPPSRTPKGKWFALSTVALLICAAVAFGAVELTRDSVQPNTATPAVAGANGPPGPTVEHPLAPTATQVSLAHASETFGLPLASPTTPEVQPSDLGPVWEIDARGGTWVALTFPAKGVFIQYGRPAEADPVDVKSMAASVPGSDLVQLNGATPALYATGNDGSGINWIEFATRGADIRVLGKNDEATLEAMAQSILAQLSSAPSS